MHWSFDRLTHNFRLGPTALATQSVLLVSSSTTYQAPFALSVASSVRYVICIISRILSRLLRALGLVIYLERKTPNVLLWQPGARSSCLSSFLRYGGKQHDMFSRSSLC